MLNEKQWNSV